LSPKKSPKKTKEIDPKRYAQILNGIKLSRLYLESCSVKQKRENLIKQKGIIVSVLDKVSYEQHENILHVTHKYYLTAKKPEMGKDFAIKISTIYCLDYDSEYQVEEDFFEVFKHINLPVNSWPYFREFVQSMTQRLNIPPLTLPLIREE